MIYKLKLIFLIDLYPDIEHVSVEQIDLKLLIKVNSFFSRGAPNVKLSQWLEVNLVLCVLEDRLNSELGSWV